MRKEICLVLGLLLALSAVGAAHAEDGIMPCYDYVSSVHASLNIDSGTASAVGKVYVGKKMQTSITVRLQRENSNGKWVTIVTWTGGDESGLCIAGGTRALISGYNYRVYVIGRVYDDEGTLIETAYRYSPTKSY